MIDIPHLKKGVGLISFSLQGRNRDTEFEDRLVDTAGEGKGGTK